MSITHSYLDLLHTYCMRKHADFAKRLNELIDEGIFSEYTATQLAKLWKVSQPMVSYLRNGYKLPKMEKAVRLSESLNCCVEWLLTGRGPKYPLEDSLGRLSSGKRRQVNEYVKFLISEAKSKQ